MEYLRCPECLEWQSLLLLLRLTRCALCDTPASAYVLAGVEVVDLTDGERRILAGGANAESVGVD